MPNRYNWVPPELTLRSTRATTQDEQPLLQHSKMRVRNARHREVSILDFIENPNLWHVLTRILSRLDRDTICNCARVNRAWRTAIDSDYVKRRIKKEVGVARSENQTTLNNCLNFYLRRHARSEWKKGRNNAKTSLEKTRQIKII
jgi:hypothetical protein